MLSLIALFLSLDLDYLCFIRTPPNYSVLNPVERVMCILNLALNGVALSQTLVEEYQHIIKNLVTKEAWRSAAAKHPNIDIQNLASKSSEEARELMKHESVAWLIRMKK